MLDDGISFNDRNEDDVMADVDVLVIGRNCLDHISLIETYPKEDSKTPLALRILEGGGQGGT